MSNAEVHACAIEEVAADSVLSPANSFGFMEGAIQMTLLILIRAASYPWRDAV